MSNSNNRCRIQKCTAKTHILPSYHRLYSSMIMMSVKIMLSSAALSDGECQNDHVSPGHSSHYLSGPGRWGKNASSKMCFSPQFWNRYVWYFIDFPACKIFILCNPILDLLLLLLACTNSFNFDIQGDLLFQPQLRHVECSHTRADSKFDKLFAILELPSVRMREKTLQSLRFSVPERGEEAWFVSVFFWHADCHFILGRISIRKCTVYRWKWLEDHVGPVHIGSRYTTPAKCSRNKFSVHECFCEHCEMFSVPLRSDLKLAHISICAVWLIVYTLRNVWGHFNVHSPGW